jgi:acyl carrier protein
MLEKENLDDILERMQTVFRDVFDDEGLVLRDDLTASEVENWDSLTHINLIVGIERKFKVKFTTAEVGSLKNAGDLAALVRKKLGGGG